MPDRKQNQTISNWEIKTSPFHTNMEISGSFIACINELTVSLKKNKNQNAIKTKRAKPTKLQE